MSGRLGLVRNDNHINVLIISPWFPNRVHTQDGNFVRRFAERVATRHTVEVVAVVPAPDLSGRQQEVQELAAPFGRVVIVYYAGDGARVQRLVNRRSAWKEALSLVHTTPDLIHAHVLIDGGIMAQRQARAWRVPYLISCHSSRYLEGDGLLRKLLDYSLAKRAAAGAYALLPVSKALQASLLRAGMRGKYEVLPNGVDTRQFRPPNTVPPSTAFRLLHLSDGSRQKNLPLLLAAFAAAKATWPALTLTLGGNIPASTVAELCAPYPALQEDIEVTGALSQAEVVAKMREHDLFVLSSSVETQGIVLAEALLCGLPVVTSSCGGPDDLNLSPEDGSLVQELTTTHFAAAITGWAAKGRPALADRQSRHQRFAPRFDEDALQARLEEIYRGAIATTKNYR